MSCFYLDVSCVCCSCNFFVKPDKYYYGHHLLTEGEGRGGTVQPCSIDSHKKKVSYD